MNKNYLNKTHLFVIVTFVLALFCSSCKNGLVDIERNDIQVTLILNNVLSSFTSYVPKDMDMYVSNGITSKIAIKAFVYNDAGQLVDQFSKTIDNYDLPSITFSSAVSGSKPMFVCFAYATWTSTAGVERTAYDITGEQLLSTLKVSRNNSYTKIPWLVLGGAITSIDLFSESIDVVVKPLGGLVYVDWENVHSHEHDNPAPDTYTFMMKFNDIATVEDGVFVYKSSLSSNYYFYADIFPAEHATYNGVYSIAFMLPSYVEGYGFGSYSPTNGQEIQTGRSSTKYITIEAGKQYCFLMDCEDYSIDLREGIME